MTLKSENEFRNITFWKLNTVSFHFDCTGECGAYLFTCKIFGDQ